MKRNFDTLDFAEVAKLIRKTVFFFSRGIYFFILGSFILKLSGNARIVFFFVQYVLELTDWLVDVKISSFSRLVAVFKISVLRNCGRLLSITQSNQTLSCR